MKKKYISPNMEVINYLVEDCILTSGAHGMLGLLDNESEAEKAYTPVSGLDSLLGD